MPTRIKNAHPFVWIFVIGFIVWGSTLRFGFVWDDFPMIVTNPSLAKWSTFLTAWNHDFWMLHDSPHLSGYWRPMVTIFHALTVEVFGKNAWVFHLINVLLHIAIACCFYQFLNNLKILRWIWVAVIFFLIHPLQSETVSFISASPDLFCAWFGWLALAIWTSPTLPSRKKVFLTMICLAVCFLCKESGVFFGIFLIATDVCLRPSIKKTTSTKKIYILIACMTLVYVGIHQLVIGNLGIRHLWGSSLWFHIATVCKLFAYQVSLLLLPLNFSPTRDFTVVSHDSDFGFWIGLILIVAFSILLFKFRKHRKVLFLGLAYVIFWFPVSNIIPAEGLIADRYLYELTMVMGMVMALACSNLKTSPKFLIPVFIVMALDGWVQSLSWASEKYLWSHATQTSPNSSVAWNQWGNVLLRDQAYAEARQAYDQAFALNTEYREASLNRAMVPYLSGHEDEALVLALQHVNRFPNDDEAHDLIGAIFEKKFDYPRSISESKKAIDLAPNVWKYKYNLAEVYMKTMDYEQAVFELQQAVILMQDRFEIWKNLALAYFQNGQYDESLHAYQELIRRFPQKADEVANEMRKVQQILDVVKGS